MRLPDQYILAIHAGMDAFRKALFVDELHNRVSVVVAHGSAAAFKFADLLITCEGGFVKAQRKETLHMSIRNLNFYWHLAVADLHSRSEVVIE